MKEVCFVCRQDRSSCDICLPPEQAAKSKGQRLLRMSAELMADIFKQGFTAGAPRYFQPTKDALPADVEVVAMRESQTLRSVTFLLASSEWAEVPEDCEIPYITTTFRAISLGDDERRCSSAEDHARCKLVDHLLRAGLNAREASTLLGNSNMIPKVWAEAMGLTAASPPLLTTNFDDTGGYMIGNETLRGSQTDEELNAAMGRQFGFPPKSPVDPPAEKPKRGREFI
jgi:hypothetical protein